MRPALTVSQNVTPATTAASNDSAASPPMEFTPESSRSASQPRLIQGRSPAV
jgi:hypothetical protein